MAAGSLSLLAGSLAPSIRAALLKAEVAALGALLLLLGRVPSFEALASASRLTGAAGPRIRRTERAIVAAVG